MNAHALRLGHVQLRVRDLERSKAFYQGLLGLPLRESRRGMAFLGAGPEHHQLALHAVGENAAASPPLGVGLSHVAFEVPDRGALLGMHRALVAAGLRVSGVDLGVSWSLYFLDPDGNEVEIYCDTRQAPGGRETWSGRGEPLDLRRAETLAAREVSVGG